MAESLSDKENITPVWVYELESRLQLRKTKLGHEIGAGAKCFTCKEKCPGLELHFWRKKCQNCRCGKEVHDVAEDDDLRFQILFKHKENSSKYLAAKAVLEIKVKDKQPKNVVLKQFGTTSDEVKPMLFDWVPSEASLLLAADYMNELPSNKMPISGSVGAKYRKIQMKKQIPLHDLLLVDREIFSEKEKFEYGKYMRRLRDDAGIGKILRVKQIQFVEESQACNIQPAQLSEMMKSNQSDIQDVTSGFRNINICPSSYNSPPVGFRPLAAIHPGYRPGACPAIRPIATYLETSPRSTMRSLPRTIPGSILRLPSEFKVQKPSFSKCNFKNPMNQPMKYEDSMLSVNNNSESSINTTCTSAVFGDNEDSMESMNITGISPLPQSPDKSIESEEKSQPLNHPGTSTPLEGIDFPDPVTTPSRYARKMAYWDSAPSNELATNNNEQKIFASDVENANSQTEGASAPPETQREVHLVEKNITCVDCQGIIEFNSIAVFIERAGANAAWHPKCFVCKECKELLVDLMYFYHRGFVYCARHYTEKLKIHRCSACDELIFVPEYTLAEGCYYHLHHFCCAECDMNLADHEYVVNDLNEDLPTCLKCYVEIYAKKCNTCGEPVKAGEQGICYNDLNWHATPECFKCAKKDCQKSLVNQKFVMIDLRPFCSKQCHFADCFTKD